MNGTAEIINALTGLAWPLIAGLVLWRLFPTIKKIITSRGFTVKVGQAELTVQEVSEKLLATTADIQGRLASITPVDSASATAQIAPSKHLLGRVLWVDDNPTNNAYEIAQLEALGVTVAQVTSTREGVTSVSGSNTQFDAVISDMGRVEPHGFNANAGIDLIRQLRDSGYLRPVFIYASRKALEKRDEVIAAGGNGVTASPTELFALLRSVGSFPATTDA